MRRRGVGVVLAIAALAGPGCSDDSRSAEDDGAPAAELVADFTYEADYRQLGPTNCPLKDVQYTDESEGDPDAWNWDFGDGGTSSEQDPIVTAFISEATLTVTRGDDTDSVTKPVQIVFC